MDWHGELTRRVAARYLREHGPMSEREFWRARAKQAETEINASCC